MSCFKSAKIRIKAIRRVKAEGGVARIRLFGRSASMSNGRNGREERGRAHPLFGVLPTVVRTIRHSFLQVDFLRVEEEQTKEVYSIAN